MHRRGQDPTNIKDGEFCNNSQRFFVVNYCCKAVHLRCLRGIGYVFGRIVVMLLPKKNLLKTAMKLRENFHKKRRQDDVMFLLSLFLNL